MEDEEIMDLYFSRDERAVVETDRKYGPYCFSLAHAILNNPQDAEETVNDTYLHTWKAIPPKRPRYFRIFLAKITRNLAFSRWRSDTAQKRGGGEMVLVLEELSECIAAPGDVEESLAGKELVKAIRNFLDTLPSREQDIFLRRYFYVEESDAIARRYGMKAATVLRTLSRTREKLRKYLAKEGYGV
ncbi:MAG: RNA polymerase sigma factor [Oscillospiraceae bacterium]|nr:RNA polymerase sigma factor [Oscillospiraceae bacterium]